MAADLCRRFEGFRSQPYLCPAGVPTIGYGSTHYADGRRVLLTDPPISKAAADRLLMLELERTYLKAVRAFCPGADTTERVAALLDFTYNLGAGNLRASTLRRKVNAGEWSQVPSQLRRWNKAAGRVLPGLVARREAEIGLLP
jgi:lysozyme